MRRLTSLFLSLLIASRVKGDLLALPALSVLPDCASTCINSTDVISTCPDDNLSCLCLSSSFQAALTDCVSTTCTVKESLTTKNATYAACGVKIRDERQTYQNQVTPVLVLAGVFFIIRFVHRSVILRSPLVSDDYMLIVTSILALATTFINRYGVATNGLGQDVWTVPFDKLYNFGKYFYISAIFYYFDLGLGKITMLMFFLRIFPTAGVQKILLFTISFCSIWTLLCALLTVFQCTPVSYYWTNWDGEHEGTCLSGNAIAWANAAVNIVLDLWMLGVPLAQLHGLQLHWKKKVGVAIMFCVGTFVTVVSIVRLQSIIVFATSTNTTRDNLPIDKWSTIELCTSIICICLPSARLFLVHYFPRIFGSVKSRTSSHPLQNSGFNTHGTHRLRSIAENPQNGQEASNDPMNFGIRPNTKTTVTITSRLSGESLHNESNNGNNMNSRHISRHTSYTVRSSTGDPGDISTFPGGVGSHQTESQGAESDASSSHSVLRKN